MVISTISLPWPCCGIIVFMQCYPWGEAKDAVTGCDIAPYAISHPIQFWVLKPEIVDVWGESYICGYSRLRVKTQSTLKILLAKIHYEPWFFFYKFKQISILSPSKIQTINICLCHWQKPTEGKGQQFTSTMAAYIYVYVSRQEINITVISWG